MKKSANRVKSDRTQLFVYGSLMSREELDRVLGHSYQGAYTPHTLQGYRREWNSSEGTYAYLNVTEDPDQVVHGFLVDVDKQELTMLDASEPTYERVEIDGIHVYVSRAEFRSRGSLVSGKYWRTVQSAIHQALPKLPSCLSMTEEAESAER